jgi:hypothetical protein
VLARRQQRQRVEVAVLIRRDSHSEVDVRLCVLGVAARAGRPQRRSFLENRFAGDADGAQVDEGDRVAVCGLDGDRTPSARDRAGEADDARSGRAHGRTGGRGHVDAAMLATRVGILSESEGS